MAEPRELGTLRETVAKALYAQRHPHNEGPPSHGYYEMADAVLDALAAAEMVVVPATRYLHPAPCSCGDFSKHPLWVPLIARGTE